MHLAAMRRNQTHRFKIPKIKTGVIVSGLQVKSKITKQLQTKPVYRFSTDLPSVPRSTRNHARPTVEGCSAKSQLRAADCVHGSMDEVTETAGCGTQQREQRVTVLVAYAESIMAERPQRAALFDAVT